MCNSIGLYKSMQVFTTATVGTPNTSLIPQLFPAPCTADPLLTPRPWKPMICLLFLVFPVSECPNWNHTVWGLSGQLLLLYTCFWDSLCSINGGLFFSAAEGYSTAVSHTGAWLSHSGASGKRKTVHPFTHVFMYYMGTFFQNIKVAEQYWKIEK